MNFLKPYVSFWKLGTWSGMYLGLYLASSLPTNLLAFFIELAGIFYWVSAPPPISWRASYTNR